MLNIGADETAISARGGARMQAAYTQPAPAHEQARGWDWCALCVTAAVLLALVLLGAVHGVPALWGPALACGSLLGAYACWAGVARCCVR